MQSPTDSESGGWASQFIVQCPECDATHSTEDLDEAVEFAVSHYRHTGHTASWESAKPLVESAIDVPTDTRWRVKCDTCDTERLFRTHDCAEDFEDNHETYAGHPVDRVDKVELPRLTEVSHEDVQDVVAYCFEQVESVDFVPANLIVAAFEDTALTRRQVGRFLSAAKSHDERTYTVGGGLIGWQVD